MRTLVAMSYSPWSERVKWTVAHHRVEHRFVEHSPVLGEIALRRRAGNLLRPATVPMWIDDDADPRVLRDSLAIARRIDAIGKGATLFPKGADAEIEAWNRRSEAMLAAGRALLLDRMIDDEASRRESIPAFVPKALHPLMMPTTTTALRFMQRKYRSTVGARDRIEATIVETLEAIRAAVTGRDTILDGFSYADITAAVVLQGIEPVADRYIHLGPATRAVWRVPKLADQYADVVAWRDRLYAARRPVV
jgi:glutathione S-transferase